MCSAKMMRCNRLFLAPHPCPIPRYATTPYPDMKLHSWALLIPHLPTRDSMDPVEG
jgi:hypothetical protein